MRLLFEPKKLPKIVKIFFFVNIIAAPSIEKSKKKFTA
jgi:hypothetical protein